MSVPAIPLNDGNRIPVLAFGTGSKFKGKASSPVISTDLPPTLFQDVTEVVEQALDAGFSHIDSAACEPVYNFTILVTGWLTFYSPGTVVYANEQHVGTAIRECGLARQDLWITTKYAGGDVFDAVHTSLRKVCRRLWKYIHLSLPFDEVCSLQLGLKHLDLYLVHGPWTIKDGDVEGVWNDMIKVRESGLSRYVPKNCVRFQCLVQRRVTSAH